MKIQITLDIPENQPQAVVGSPAFFSSLPHDIQDHLKSRKELFDTANHDVKVLAEHMNSINDMLEASDEYPEDKIPEAISKLVYYTLRQQMSTARLDEYMEACEADESEIEAVMDVFYDVTETADEFYDQMISLFDFFTYHVPSDLMQHVIGENAKKAAAKDPKKTVEDICQEFHDTFCDRVCSVKDACTTCKTCDFNPKRAGKETQPKEAPEPEPEAKTKPSPSGVICTISGNVANNGIRSLLKNPEFNEFLDKLARHVLDAIQ